jgi:hypothetical protein
VVRRRRGRWPVVRLGSIWWIVLRPKSFRVNLHKNLVAKLKPKLQKYLFKKIEPNSL